MSCNAERFDQQVAERRRIDSKLRAAWAGAIVSSVRMDPARAGDIDCVLDVHVHDANRIAVIEAKQADVSAVRAQRRLGDFLASLGHELRNPLAGISHAIEVLSGIGSRDVEVNEMHGIILRQSQQMAHLIDDLLDVSRVAHGKLQIRLERLDLVELIRRICADFLRSATASGISFEVVLPAEPLWINADPTRITQILVNLLQNAVKFTNAKGAISVTLQQNAECSLGTLSVRDSGIGMEPIALTHVFEPFNQAEGSLTGSRDGLGLGLSLVKGLVEMHGGQVTAESAGLGQGSQFSVRLPLGAMPLVNLVQPAKALLCESSYRILIIDDSRDVVYPLTRLLTRMGHDVHVAADGKIGIAAARQFRPHLVLCDIGLPGNIDGYAVAAVLRGGMDTRNSHLVAVTGYSRDEDRRRAIESGFDRHMTKPVGIQELEFILADLPTDLGVTMPIPTALPRALKLSQGALQNASPVLVFD